MGININSSIYGVESDWLSVYDDTIKIATLSKNFLPYFNHTLGAGLVEETFTEEGVDTSICPIAADSGFAANNVTYVTYEDNEIKTFNKTGEQSPIMFVTTKRGYGNNTILLNYMTKRQNVQNSSWSSRYKATLYTQPDFPCVMTSMTQPISEFTYRNVILLICVTAAKTKDFTTSDVQKFDLKTYVDSKVIEYPYVLCVSVLPFRKTTTGFSFFASVTTDTTDISATTSQTNSTFGFIPIGNPNILEDNIWITQNTIFTENIITDNGTLSDYGIMPVIGGFSDFYTNGLVTQSNENYIQTYAADKFKILTHSSRADRVFTTWENPNPNDFFKWCLTQTAYLGMFYTESYRNITSSEDFYSSEYTHMGIIDNSGITHGQYVTGKDIEKYEQSKWDSLKNQSPFDYTKKPDNSKYDDETKLNTNILTKIGGSFHNIYACTALTLQYIYKYLYTVVAPDSTQESLSQNFLTNNPIDCIVGCRQYQFKVDTLTGSIPIKVGNTTASLGGTSIQGYTLKQNFQILDMGSVFYYPFFGDFRDYEPYSSALLYIPYIGYIPISPSEYINNNLSVKIIVDLITGSCIALIYRNGIVMQDIAGQMGVQVPITGIQTADYANNLHRNSVNVLTNTLSTVSGTALGVASTAVSAATGNIPIAIMSGINTVSNIIGGAISTSESKYELDHTKVPFASSGSASPSCECINEQTARLILKRPVMDDTYNAAIYGKTIGFACCKNDYISNYSGFTVMKNPYFECDATDTEKDMINECLERGVIL